MVKESQAERYVIINADDLGITRSTNQAIFELFKNNRITSASIMMPCAEAQHAAKLHREANLASIGIHLTLSSSEGQFLKPVFEKRKLTSLVTEDGYFSHNVSILETNADAEEVRIELEAQIQAALSHGIKPTHLDSHAGSVMGLYHGRDFLEVVFDLCEKYGLPFNLPKKIVKQPIFSDDQKKLYATRIQSAKERGIYLIDDLYTLPYHLEENEGYFGMKEKLLNRISNLSAGITQIVSHPSYVTPELKALTAHYRKREMEFHLLNDQDVRHHLQKENIKLISWETILKWQRKTRF